MLFHLTEHCSLGCPHCMVSCTPSGKHATNETVDQFIEFAKWTGTIKIGIAGGEPTEHPDFLNLFEKILSVFSGSTICILMTNGRFLRDADFTKHLIDLQHRYRFLIQVSALKGIYPHREETIKWYTTWVREFYASMLIENITVVEKLGRGKYWDSSHLGKLWERQAPGCFNMFSTALHATDFRHALELLTGANTDIMTNFCKPLIAWDGNVYAGETPECLKLGYLSEGYDKIFNVLKTSKPCCRCGIQIPDQYNLWK